MAQTQWIGIGYFLPAQPSKSRVFVWRRLKSIGAQIIKPGMAALPASPENVVKFEELAEKIEEFTGEAILIEFNFLNDDNDKSLRFKFAEAERRQRKELIENCSEIITQIENESDENAKSVLGQRLAKVLGKYFKTNEKTPAVLGTDDLEKGLGEIYDALKSVPAELKAMLFKERRK